MKYLVVSDIHGSNYYTNKIKEIVNYEQPNKIILLGDLYYHGPRNPLTKEYNPMEVAKILNSFKDIICTRNHNWLLKSGVITNNIKVVNLTYFTSLKLNF